MKLKTYEIKNIQNLRQTRNVTKDPYEIKNIQNKRKKFTKEFTIPKEVALQGQFKDEDGVIRKREVDQLSKWTPHNNKNRAPEEIILTSVLIEKGKQIFELKKRHCDQEDKFNNNHGPPDQNQ